MEDLSKLKGISATKICTLCKRELPVSNFGKHTTSKDGLQSWCRECSTKYATLRVKYARFGGVKLCRLCNQLKPKTEFRKDDSYLMGYSIICKKCESEMTAPKTVKEVAKEAPKETPVMVTPDLSKFYISDLITELKRRGVTGKINLEYEF